MEIPDSLQAKLDLYQSSSWLEREKQELFGVDSWLAVLNGQHVSAESYSPLVDNMPRDKLESILRETREVIAQCATAMPPHEDFIRKHCADSILHQ
jgi:tryptophan halogenase